MNPYFVFQGCQKMPIRVAISLADIEIHFLDCCQMMGKLSTNFAMVPDSLGEFVSNLASCETNCGEEDLSLRPEFLDAF